MFVTSVGKGLLDLGIFGVGVAFSDVKLTDWAYSTSVISWFLQACKIYTVSMHHQHNHINTYVTGSAKRKA